jgi:2-dehydropantoate 2-reductase
MTDKRIAVLGTGANGSSIAADLTSAGLDVTLIEQWPAHVSAMKAHGLRIEMPDDTLEVEVRAHDLCDVATLREPFDVVLVVVKAYDTRWACELIKPLVAPEGLVVGVQNGMTSETVADVVGAARTMGCVIEVAAMMTEPGVVQRHSPPSRARFVVGSLSPLTAGREAEIADLLACSGTVEIEADINSAKWMKLVLNCPTLVPSAILGLPIREATALPAMRRLMLLAGREALDVGAARGHQVLPSFGLSAQDLRDADDVIELLLGARESFVLPSTTTTVLHDWIKGRRSEVDDVNGLVVREQERLGGSAPANAAILEVAHRIERGELTPQPSNLDLLLACADRLERSPVG